MAVEQKITCSNIWKLFGPDEKRIIKNLDKNLSIKEVQEKTGHVVAVKDVSFSIVKGETFVVMGLSGSGKSTFCLLYTSPSPRDQRGSRMPSSA